MNFCSAHNQEFHNRLAAILMRFVDINSVKKHLLTPLPGVSLSTVDGFSDESD